MSSPNVSGASRQIVQIWAGASVGDDPINQSEETLEDRSGRYTIHKRGCSGLCFAFVLPSRSNILWPLVINSSHSLVVSEMARLPPSTISLFPPLAVDLRGGGGHVGGGRRYTFPVSQRI